MVGSPWRRREGQRGETWGDQTDEEVRQVMRGSDKEGEGRSAVIRRVGERLDSIEHGGRELRDTGMVRQELIG